MVIAWLISGLIGWILLIRIRYVLDQLPQLDKTTITGYVRGFIFAILLGPLSIAFFAYLLWGIFND